MTGGPAAAALHERLGGALAEARACAAGHTCGAFPTRRSGTGPGRTGRAYWASRKGSTRRGSGASPTGSGAPPTAWPSASSAPAFPSPTNKSEQGMRGFVGDRGSSPMLAGAPGRRWYSDGKGRRNTWLNKGLDPFHEMGAALGADPGREWAQVLTEGERARAGGAPGRGAIRRMEAAVWRACRAAVSRGPPEAADARMPTLCGTGKARCDGGGTAPQGPRCRARGVLRHRPPPRRPPPRRPPPRRPPRACPTCSSRIPLPPAPLPPRRRAGLARRQPGGHGTL